MVDTLHRHNLRQTPIVVSSRAMVSNQVGINNRGLANNQVMDSSLDTVSRVGTSKPAMANNQVVISSQADISRAHMELELHLMVHRAL